MSSKSRSGTDVTGEMAEIDGTGRESASATTLSGPETWTMEEVNSVMKESWRVCRGERSARLDRAPQSGLWSVKTVKRRPSRTWRKCLMARKTASNSRSKVLYFCSAELSFLEKKDNGRWSACA